LLAPFLVKLATNGADGIALDVFLRRQLLLLLPLRLPLVPLLVPVPPPRLLRPPARDPSDLARRSNAYTCAVATRPCKELPALSSRQEPRNGEREKDGGETFGQNSGMAAGATQG